MSPTLPLSQRRKGPSSLPQLFFSSVQLVLISNALYFNTSASSVFLFIPLYRTLNALFFRSNLEMENSFIDPRLLSPRKDQSLIWLEFYIILTTTVMGIRLKGDT